VGFTDFDGLASLLENAPVIPELGSGYLRGLDWAPGPLPLILTVEKDLSTRAVWTLPLTGKPRKLFEGRDLAEAVWSPTGAALYLLNSESSMGTLSRLDLDRLGAPLSPPRDLLQGFTGEGVSVSNDGRRLMFTRRQQRATLEAQSLDPTSDQRGPVTTGTYQDRGPKYSPDGKTVAFVRDTGSGGNLFTIDVPGGTPRQQTFLDGTMFGAAFSPDGQSLAFTFRPRNGATKLGIIPVKGGQPAWVDVAVGAGVAWAPSESILVQTPGNRNIEMISPATGEHHPLFSTPSGFVTTPVASGDGQHLALLWNRDNPGVYVVSIRNPSDQRFLLTDAMPMAFSSDGSALFAWLPRQQQVVRIGVGGGAPETLAAIPVQDPRLFRGDVTGDGTRLVFSNPQASTDVWLVENFDPAVVR